MSYNGWKNRETWNVALWINNDQGLYELAKEARKIAPRAPYAVFVDMVGADRTPDGILWDGRAISRAEINACIREL